MAYVVDLEEEENDLPTTLLRSVHDCPATESSHDINTSNMLIQVVGLKVLNEHQHILLVPSALLLVIIKISCFET